MSGAAFSSVPTPGRHAATPRSDADAAISGTATTVRGHAAAGCHAESAFLGSATAGWGSAMTADPQKAAADPQKATAAPQTATADPQTAGAAMEEAAAGGCPGGSLRQKGATGVSGGISCLDGATAAETEGAAVPHKADSGPQTAETKEEGPVGASSSGRTDGCDARKARAEGISPPAAGGLWFPAGRAARRGRAGR